jgi:hypothetical protein
MTLWQVVSSQPKHQARVGFLAGLRLRARLGFFFARRATMQPDREADDALLPRDLWERVSNGEVDVAATAAPAQLGNQPEEARHAA